MGGPGKPSVEEIFSAALEMGTPAERSAYLDRACHSDPALRSRLEELLRAHAEAGDFLSAPALELDTTLASVPGGEQPGGRIGRYRLLQQIGEGGFGVVYLAEQQEPVRRKVALKIIKLGMDTRQVIARFEAERQALALMDHPHVAHVLDAGATETGRPYFVMELVKGVKITAYCDRQRLSTDQRLRLFLRVCQAVQHAHQKGIIHRDLKPNNVLVALHGSEPVPKVIDFGIAKATSQRLTDKTLFTEFRQFIGTPEYMSPDQVDASGLDVDTRSDIYSLGVLLYELLTGSTPLEARALRQADYEELRRIIREVEPPRPSARVQALLAADSELARRRGSEPAALCRRLRGDLDWIVMRALEKDRTRRYQSAGELAADIERHLRHEPVTASPPSARYRLFKFVRRHRPAVAAAAAGAAAVLAGLSLATVGFIHANRARAALQAERDVAQAARLQAEQARAREHAQRTRAEANAELARRQAAEARALSEFLQAMLASVDPSRALGREVSVHYVLDEAARRVGQGALADQPEVAAAVHLTLGQTYLALGLYDAAETHLRQADAIRTRLLGQEHPDTLRARSVLAEVLTNRYRYAEAEALARRTADAQRRLLGPAHRDTLTTMSRLGIALWRQEKLAEAEEVHSRTLEIQRRVLGEEQIDTLRSKANLGAVFQAQGRYAAAEALQRAALRAERRLLGPEHPELSRPLNSLGLTLERQGKYAQAEALYRQAWQLDRRLRGPDHPQTQIPLNNLLRVLRTQGKTAQTRPLVLDRLAHLRRQAQRPDADALTLNSYAWELLTCEPADLRDPQAAVAIARRAVELDGARDANILDTLALAFRLSGDLDSAISTQRLALSRARAGGPYNVAELGMRLANYLLEKGDLLGAAKVSWGGLTARLGQSLAEDVVPGGALALRAQALLADKRFADAEPLLRACLVTRQKALPGHHWLTAEARLLLGAALAGQGKYVEAEPLLLDAYADLRDSPQTPEQRRRQALRRIVRLYESWGKGEQAARWRAELAGRPAARANEARRRGQAGRGRRAGGRDSRGR